MLLNCSASEASANASYNLTVQQERKTQQRVCCANCTHHSSEITAHTGAQTQPAKQILNISHIPYKRCSLADEAPTRECTMRSWQPCHCGFCSITELGQGNLVWRMYKFSMESASLQALSAASSHVLCLDVLGVVIGYFLSVLGLCCFTLSE